jgi:hypothetical protein
MATSSVQRTAVRTYDYTCKVYGYTAHFATAHGRVGSRILFARTWGGEFGPAQFRSRQQLAELLRTWRQIAALGSEHGTLVRHTIGYL